MIKLGAGVGGIFRFYVAKADAMGNPAAGTVQEIAGESPNLVTDIGLDRMASNTGYLARCFVGSGSKPPEPSDTSVQSLVASASVDNDNTSNGRTSTEPYYTWVRNSYVFPVGSAAGNLSEVCVGWSPSSGVFSRALILDEQGAPTSITILPDEILIITYEFRMYPPTEDFSGTVNIGGEDYNWTGRASDVLIPNGWSQFRDGQNMEFNTNVQGNATAFSGSLGSITGSPSGVSANRTSSVSVPYVPGTQRRSIVAEWGISAANFGIKSVRIASRTTAWQIEFDRPIPKTGDDVLSLTMGYSWARRS